MRDILFDALSGRKQIVVFNDQKSTWKKSTQAFVKIPFWDHCCS